MKKCPSCESEENQVKNGLNPSGSQWYRCKSCHRTCTPAPMEPGYPQAVKEQTIKLYVDGMNLRRIGRTLGVNHQSVANWVNRPVEGLAKAPLPDDVEIIELDQLFTFIDAKKRGLPDDGC